MYFNVSFYSFLSFNFVNLTVFSEFALKVPPKVIIYQHFTTNFVELSSKFILDITCVLLMKLKGFV